jgi:hypothetical protein
MISLPNSASDFDPAIGKIKNGAGATLRRFFMDFAAHS